MTQRRHHEPDEDRVSRALRALEEFQREPEPRDQAAFLAAHEDLREFLETLLQEDEEEDDDDQIIGDYRIVREVGRGAMGVVFEAEQIGLGRTVAVKLLPPHLTLDAGSIRRFRREAQLAARLDDPHIPEIYDVFHDGDQHCFAMEFVRGAPLDRVLDGLRQVPVAERTAKTLRRIIHERRCLADGEVADKDLATDTWGTSYVRAVVDIASQIALALAHAHRGGVIHLDVKPGNILVRSDGIAVLTDFGVARLERVVSMTLTRDFRGTASYASPEHENPKLVGPRSDVFSLGTTLYELLTWHRPFDSESLIELRLQVEQHVPPTPSRLNAAVPRDLAAIVDKAIEKDPRDRYQDADAFAADLKRWLDGRPVVARPVPLGVRLRRWIARNPRASAVITVLVFAASLITFLGMRLGTETAKIASLAPSDALENLRVAARSLYPAWPKNQSRLAALVTEAEAVLGQQRQVARRLQDMRQTLAPEAVPSPLFPFPRNDELQTLETMCGQLTAAIDAADNDAADNDRLADRLSQRREPLATRLTRLKTEREGWGWHGCFDGADRSLCVSYERQLVAMRRLRTTGLAALRARAAFAASVRQRSIVAFATRWQRTVTAVRKDYGLPDFEPQIGLVPLGPDPASGYQEFGHLASGKIPQRDDASGELILTSKTGLVFVLLPGGTTTIGAHPTNGPNVDPQATVSEWPQIEVQIEPFFLSKFEMSHAQWQRLAQGNLDYLQPPLRAEFEAHFERLPVVLISARLGGRLCAEHGLELPTEAQWEYACRAGTTTPWYVGDDPAELAGVANVKGLSGSGSGPPPRRRAMSLAMRPNDFGLHNMHGNVWELTRSSFKNYVAAHATSDLLVVRGGSSYETAASARSAFRQAVQPMYSSMTIGLRPARRLY